MAIPILVVEKTEDNKLKSTKTKTITIENIYSYKYLISQKESILAKRQEDNNRYDKELAEVENLLVECERLGIKEEIKKDKEETILVD